MFENFLTIISNVIIVKISIKQNELINMKLTLKL